MCSHSQRYSTVTFQFIRRLDIIFVKSQAVERLFLTLHCFLFVDDSAVADARRQVNGSLARANNLKDRLMKVISKTEMSKQGEKIKC